MYKYMYMYIYYYAKTPEALVCALRDTLECLKVGPRNLL